MEKVVIGNAELYRRDCMAAMREMPDNAFDLAIVDPPYRDMKDNQPTKDMRNNGSMAQFGNKPTPEFFAELNRVAKNCIIWGANNFQLPPFKGFVIWKKITISENFTMSMCEMASLSEGLSTTSKCFEYAPQDVNRIHPTQKPVRLYQWLLKHYAKPGDTILDTHHGSGSLPIECLENGYSVTAYGIDPGCFGAACKRLMAA